MSAPTKSTRLSRSSRTRKIPFTPRVDLTGQTFGHLRVESRIVKIRKSRSISYWKCICLLCGNTCEIFHGNLGSGRSTRCSDCRFKGRPEKQPLKKHLLYSRWRRLQSNGTIDPRWNCFVTFLEDVLLPVNPDGTRESCGPVDLECRTARALTLSVPMINKARAKFLIRPEPDQLFGPENYVWSDHPSISRTIESRTIKERGKPLSLKPSEWANYLGVSRQWIHHCLGKGMTIDDIIKTRNNK